MELLYCVDNYFSSLLHPRMFLLLHVDVVVLPFFWSDFRKVLYAQRQRGLSHDHLILVVVGLLLSRKVVHEEHAYLISLLLAQIGGQLRYHLSMDDFVWGFLWQWSFRLLFWTLFYRIENA